nr:hypothetical protein CFP56_42093 [Quercus suber]
MVLSDPAAPSQRDRYDALNVIKGCGGLTNLVSPFLKIRVFRFYLEAENGIESTKVVAFIHGPCQRCGVLGVAGEGHALVWDSSTTWVWQDVLLHGAWRDAGTALCRQVAEHSFAAVGRDVDVTVPSFRSGRRDYRGACPDAKEPALGQPCIRMLHAQYPCHENPASTSSADESQVTTTKSFLTSHNGRHEKAHGLREQVEVGRNGKADVPFPVVPWHVSRDHDTL